MSMIPKSLLSLACLLAMSSFSVLAAEPDHHFPLKDGDIWVMAGDSITAQHLHTNYFEAFCYARYPQLKFAFRNSGVGGHTIPSTLARFDYDVAAWKPTVVSVELGMNDAGRTSSEDFIKNMHTWIERVRSIHARPIIFAPSPVNDGTIMSQVAPGNRNQRLHEYSRDLKEVAKQEGIPYVDQFHDLVDIWGKNKPNEMVAEALPAIRSLAKQSGVAGSEHLQEFLAAQAALKEKPISLQGNPVHPGPAGQLMMAASLLKGLGAEGFVSSVSMNASGKEVVAKGCEVTNASLKDGVLSFERLDHSSPFPIPEDAAAVLPMAPAVFELSQYTLAITGLQPGKYSLKVNGVTIANLTADQLAQGVNLTAHGPHMLNEAKNPIAVQGKAILDAVAAKEGVVGKWRSLSKAAHRKGASADFKKQLDALTKTVEEADEKIRAAAEPQRLKFELAAKS